MSLTKEQREARLEIPLQYIKMRVHDALDKALIDMFPFPRSGDADIWQLHLFETALTNFVISWVIDNVPGFEVE